MSGDPAAPDKPADSPLSSDTLIKGTPLPRAMAGGPPKSAISARGTSPAAETVVKPVPEAVLRAGAEQSPPPSRPASPPPRPDTVVLDAKDQPPPRPGSQTQVISPMAVLDKLSLVLQLQKRGRGASSDELPFVMVNETRQLLSYRQAVYFSMWRGRPDLRGVSGLAVPDKSAPYAQWLTKFVKWYAVGPNGGKIHSVDLSVIEAEAENPPKWFSEWREWVPASMLWAPLISSRGGLDGVVCYFRETLFNEAETMLATHLAESYAQSLALASAGKRKRSRSLSPLLFLLFLAAVAACFVPVRQSVLAPAEVTAKRPALVRSGLDGVIDRFLVEPNQRVKAGDVLIRLEDAQLRTRLAVAKKAEDMAQAEYRQLLQAGLSDPKAKQRIPLIQGRIEQLTAETAYMENLMERVAIASPIDGVVLCDNPDEWLGRPVSLGQRIMLVANPDVLELEIRLPANEALEVKVGDSLMFYPNVQPISPMEARVTYVGYRAGEVPGVGMAYILRADIAGDGKPLLGLRGMAKLYGPEQPLGLNIFRTPLMAARQWLGL